MCNNMMNYNLLNVNYIIIDYACDSPIKWLLCYITAIITVLIVVNELVTLVINLFTNKVEQATKR